MPAHIATRRPICSLGLSCAHFTLENTVFDPSTGVSASETATTPLFSTTTTSVRTFGGFWSEARLRADDAKSTSVRPAAAVVPWRTALEELLNVGYGLQSQCRFVAGAW